MLQKLRRLIILKLIDYKLTLPFFILTLIKVRELDSNTSKKNKDYLLALNSGRFRSDLQILEDTNLFKIYVLDYQWHSFLFRYFYPVENWVGTANILKDADESVLNAKKKYHEFLAGFWIKVLRFYKVKAVISAAVHYETDLDYGYVASKYNIPYIVLHRENLSLSVASRNKRQWEANNFSRFGGDHIIVGNNIAKEIWQKGEFIDSNRITNCGSLRMDNYVSQVKETNEIVKQVKKNGDKRKLVFFSFHPGVGVLQLKHRDTIDVWEGNDDILLSDFFHNIHLSLIQLAIENDDLDVIIKTKWGGKWISNIINLCDEAGTSYSNIINLTVTDKEDTHKLILEADIVSSYGSTTVLEAALLPIPVLIPLLNEAQNEKVADGIQYLMIEDELNEAGIYFIRDKIKHEEIIKSDYVNYMPTKMQMNKRRLLFNKYISNVNGGAVDKFSEVIKKTITEKYIN